MYNPQVIVTKDMTSCLKLKNNELLVYAVINTFCQLQGVFKESEEYIADVLNIQKKTVLNTLDKLEEKQLIKKAMKDNTLVGYTITGYEEYVEPKKVKHKADTKKRYGDNNNVLLTDKEYENLKNKFVDYETKINNLSYYIASKGAKYKNHYMTILAWNRNNTNKQNKPTSYKSSYNNSYNSKYDKY